MDLLRSLARQCLVACAAAALFAGAWVCFDRAYLPARERNRVARERLEELRGEVRGLRDRLRFVRERCSRLEAAEPMAVEEAIREQLRWGRPGEYVLADGVAASASEPTENDTR